jgi:6-phosphogluconolactonase
MKIGMKAGLLLGGVMAVAGCSGFWNALSSSSTGTTSTTDSSGVFYVLNQAAKTIAGFSISSGTLVDVSGSPYSLAAAPSCIAIAPGGSFLFVGTVNGIYLYSVGSGGALTLGNNGNPISTDLAAAMQVNGSWLVDAFINSGGQVQMDAIPINSSTGAYAGSGGAPPDQTFSIANNPAVQAGQMILSPDTDNLFLALGTGGAIVVPFSASNGSNPLGTTAKIITPLNNGGGALSVAVDPNERVFYVGETDENSTSNSGGLVVYNYSSLSGTPTQITGSPIASGGLSPSAILAEASGDYVYVANGSGETAAGNIAWFPITASGTTYTIAAGSSITSGIFPVSLAEDSDDKFVLAVSTGGSTSSGDPDLGAFTMSSGALTLNISSTTGTDPVGAIAVAALP